MSRVPMGSDGAMLDGLNEKLRKRLFLVPQGISADLIATREGFTRDDVDTFRCQPAEGGARRSKEALRRLAVRGQGPQRATSVLDRDEHPRADTTLERLAGLKPAFAEMGEMGGVDELALQRYPDTKEIEHVHTAGNSSGIVDGAASC